MTNVRQGLIYRLAWFSLAALLCMFSLRAAFAGASWTHAITAAAWALFAVRWFMQPVFTAASFTKGWRGGAALALGSTMLRANLGIAALALLVVSFILRTTSGA